MSYNVILLPAAEDDYQEILRYFERQFDSQQAIRSFVKDFGEVLLRLEETPTIYGYSRDEVLRQREYRKFLIGRYVALFKIDEPRNAVEIYRIFHGTQNYTKYFEYITMQMYIEVDKQKIYLNHCPFLCYGGAFRDTWQLFGHVHTSKNNTGKDKSRLQMLFPTQYDVGVDNNDFTPVSFAQVKAIIEKQADEQSKSSYNPPPE